MTDLLPKLLEEKATADRLDVSTRFLQNERRKGHISAYKIAGKWRYAVEDIIEYMEAQKCPAHGKTKTTGSPSSETPKSGISTSARPDASAGSALIQRAGAKLRHSKQNGGSNDTSPATRN
jgi:hypothetical protein